MTERIVRCRVVDRLGNRCTGEAVVADAELKICVRHLAEAKRLLDEVLAAPAVPRPAVRDTTR